MSDENPHPFNRSAIDDVLRTVSGGVATSVRKQIVDAVEDGLRDYLAGVINLNSLGNLGTPQVMVRVRTFQTILDEFRRILDDRYAHVLEHIGQNIGFNFGVSLVSILRNANWIPLNFEALLEFWARFDSSAQIGQVRFSYEKASGEAVVDVRIKDLFLTLGYGQDEPLRHCGFMVGYFAAGMDLVSLLWTRWIRNSIYASPETSWRANRCVNQGQDHEYVTAFTVGLRPEKFPEARDVLVLAIDACQAGNWVESMIDARICLENCLLRIVGEVPSTKFSFGRLLEQLRGVRADIDYEKWRTTYALCSESAHQVSSQNEIAVLGHLFNVWTCLNEGENVELSPEQLGLLRHAREKYLIP